MIHTNRKDGDRDREDSSFHNSNNNSNKGGSFGISINQLKTQQAPATTTSLLASSRPVEPAVPSPPVQSNRLLAGCMAYEFLTRGTLFGQKFDPARAEAVPLAAAEPKPRPTQAGPEPKRPKVQPNRSYTEIAELLKGDGAHIPGVVNPTQLSRWIQM